LHEEQHNFPNPCLAVVFSPNLIPQLYYFILFWER